MTMTHDYKDNDLLTRVHDLGYSVFTSGAWNLNLIGVRTESRTSGQFDDWFNIICWDEQDRLIHRQFQCTTDPATYFLSKPINVNGAAILCAGQYRGAYRIAKHRGKYDALCQRKAVKVYRDDNRDEILDMEVDDIQQGLYGINIHRAGEKNEAPNNWKWSAGCQVLPSPIDFDEVMVYARRQLKERGWDSFTYTLIED